MDLERGLLLGTDRSEREIIRHENSVAGRMGSELVEHPKNEAAKRGLFPGVQHEGGIIAR